jgi:hypothetical protein
VLGKCLKIALRADAQHAHAPVNDLQADLRGASRMIDLFQHPARVSRVREREIGLNEL